MFETKLNMILLAFLENTVNRKTIININADTQKLIQLNTEKSNKLLSDFIYPSKDHSFLENMYMLIKIRLIHI